MRGLDKDSRPSFLDPIMGTSYHPKTHSTQMRYLRYASAEAAANAIPQLNGSLLNGSAIEADTWEKAAK